MKWKKIKWKKIGNFVGIVLGTAYIIAVLYLEATKKLDWKSLLILFLFFLVWGIIVFANLAAFFDDKEIKFLGLTIVSNKKAESEEQSINLADFAELQKKIENLEKRVRTIEEKLSKPEKEDFHKEFNQFKSYRPDLDFAVLEEYVSPSHLTEFVNLVKRAKENKYDLASDSTYLQLYKDFRERIAHRLNAVLENYDYSGKLSVRMQEHLKDAIISVPTNQEVIKSVKEELLIADENSKLEITDAFFKATNDLEELTNE